MKLYRKVGVDVRKKGVELFRRITADVYGTFCPVYRENEKEGIVLHTDGVGSKPVQAYLHWRESGETRWFDLTQDLIAMNLDDAVCVGAHRFFFVDYLAVNPERVPKDKLIRELSSGFERWLENFRKEKTEFVFLGGETADLPDQIKTFDLAGTVLGKVEMKKMIAGKIESGDVIVGLRSGGGYRLERGKNSGIMCNGITLARHALLKPAYAKKYPEIADGKYWGRFEWDEYVDELEMTVGEAILSPTSIYTPLVLRILEKVEGISALVHNTGGGLTKCLRLGKNIRFIKDSLPEPDPIFLLIQREGGVRWEEMFEVFNMGVGFEIYAKKDAVESVISECEKWGLEARVIGRCERGDTSVVIKSKWGSFEYR